MKIERFVVGWITSPAGLWRKGDSFEEPLRFPVPAYVIETDTERILVDAGLHPGAIADPVAHYESEAVAAFALEQEAGVAEHVDLTTLTRVVVTHLHFDHAGGLALLPASLPVVLQRREWEAASDAEIAARNFFHARDTEGLEDRVVLVDGEHDLLGDGSVVLLPTPGHTPGHQSVRAGDVVIGGDVCHFATGFDDLRFPVFADDFDAQRASALELRALRDDAGLTVLPGHDPAVIVPGLVA